jgi:hypothetical protein
VNFELKDVMDFTNLIPIFEFKNTFKDR